MPMPVSRTATRTRPSSSSTQTCTDPRAVNYGRYLICTQEFGHRFGTFLRITPQPGSPMPVTDAGTEPPDGGAMDDAGIEPDTGMMVMPMPDGSMTIGDVALWEKTGGRSGVYRRDTSGGDANASDVSDTVTNVVES